MKNELIYDWNLAAQSGGGVGAVPGIAPGTAVLLNDESLRDGLQSPSVRDPSIPEKIGNSSSDGSAWD